MMRYALALVLLASPALAHEAPTGWRYEAFCCNGNEQRGDCQPIDAENVRATQSGWLIVLDPGGHRKVTKRQVFTVPYDKAKPSPDGMFHACLYPTEDKMRCFYAPPMGY